VGLEFDFEIAPDRMPHLDGNLNCNILVPSAWGGTLQGIHGEHICGLICATSL
jgi:hypothetical protein